MPAPGQYEVKSKILEGPTYTMGQKREEKILQSVGPGEYETPVEKGKGVTIGQRMQSKAPEELPAPGDYELKSTIKEGPEYSMMQRREEKIRQTVGPGEYEVPEDKGQGVTMGQRL